MNPYIQYMYSYPHKTAYRPLEGIFLQDYAYFLAGSGQGLYLHLPFCQAKCGYCNLFSVTGQGTESINLYLDAVGRQSRQYQEILSAFGTEFSEVVIGGGTPLLLSEGQLDRMFGILKAYFRYGKNREMGIETAPNQTSRGKLSILAQAGVTRVSMGIQSFSDQELQALGRQHCAKRAWEGLELLKSFDFPCVNVDFIYGIPEQTVESLLASLRGALAFAPEEIFLYPLYLKHGAWLERHLAKKGGPLPDPGFTYLQYKEASAFLRGEGYRQDSMRRFIRKQAYSVKSNMSVFPRKQMDSKNNQSVPEDKNELGRLQGKEDERSFSECGFGNSLALGCGGRSYLGNLHFCTPYAIPGQECLWQLQRFVQLKDFSQITHGILLSKDEMKRRYVIRHLLIRPGLSLQRYKAHFGTNAMADFPLLQDWVAQGYAQIANTGFLSLTAKGLGLSDYLGAQLISTEVRKKMAEWEDIHGL